MFWGEPIYIKFFTDTVAKLEKVKNDFTYFLVTE